MVSSRRLRWPWIVLFTTIALAVLFYGAAGWYFSDMVHERSLAAVPYDPADLQQGTVVGIEGSGDKARIRLLPVESERADTTFDNAIVGLTFGDSVVVAGPALVDAEGTRTRPVRDIVGKAPQPGDSYGLSRDVWLTPAQAGLSSQDVTLTTLGGMQFPAWLVPAGSPLRWAILTHGRGASRSEMLRMARVLHKLDYNVLIISYRGDPGAPPYGDGMSQYGLVEWEEVEAAVRFASDKGATRTVLGGTSHGGAVTLGFLSRSSLAPRVDGVILDAPVSSLRDVLDEGAEFVTLPIGGMAIPESLEDTAFLITRLRFGVNYAAVDYTDMKDLVEVPLLTIQGSADKSVAEPVNDRFMTQGSGQKGTYVVVKGADHVLSWNVNPEKYDKAIATFIRGLGKAKQR